MIIANADTINKLLALINSNMESIQDDVRMDRVLEILNHLTGDDA
jgi:hypothetical protein